jgi:hypothetical protein
MIIPRCGESYSFSHDQALHEPQTERRSLHSRRGGLAVMFCVLLAGWARCFGQSAQSSLHYELLDGSELTDECPICGRPTIVAPLRGSFELRLLGETPIGATYAVEDIRFTSGSAAGAAYEMRGSGVLQIGGEVALVQRMSLTNQISKSGGSDVTTNAIMVNEVGLLERRQPMLQIHLRQTNGTLTQVYELQIAAAPLREVWFSTTATFHSALSPGASNAFSGGDLLSSTGRAVRRNHELVGPLGVMPPTPDLGLDAVGLLPGAVLAFSTEEDAFSETQGPVHHGDIVSDRGNILLRNQDVLNAFAVPGPAPDAGLDAMQVLPADGAGTNEVWFSVERDVFSDRLGKALHRGDLLSSRGEVIRSNAQLVERFQPVNSFFDFGLDAIYVWPSGEIWFSTELGFVGANSQTFNAGDLLSDQGYVVYRNLDLMKPFAPLEDLADFGLDAVWIISDVSRPDAAPRLTEIRRSKGSIELRWQGQGRVFQVESAEDITGAFLPASPIGPELNWTDSTAAGTGNRFYRLRQW